MFLSRRNTRVKITMQSNFWSQDPQSDGIFRILFSHLMRALGNEIKLLRQSQQTTVKKMVIDSWNCLISQFESPKERREAFDGVVNDNELPLKGLNVAVKDNICMTEAPTTCGSKILEDHRSPIEATCVSLLLNAGAKIIGKCNMDEFAMGSHNIHSAYGRVKNPLKPESLLSAGGSSGGSAAAVASGLADVSLGTDTGGSVRLPAAFCGIWGLRPTYGRISRYGIVPLAHSLDTVGIMSRSLDTLRRVFQVLDIHDSKDMTSADAVNRKPRGKAKPTKIIGIPDHFIHEKTDPEILSAYEEFIDLLRQNNYTIKTVQIPTAHHARPLYTAVAFSEISSNLSKFDGKDFSLEASKVSKSNNENINETTDQEQDGSSHLNSISQIRSELLGAEVQHRILTGTYLLSTKPELILKAKQVIEILKQEFHQAFEVGGCDALCTPTTARLPPYLDTPISPEDELLTDMMTIPSSLARLPSLSIPFKKSQDGRPIGMQLISNSHCDNMLLDIAESLNILPVPPCD